MMWPILAGIALCFGYLVGSKAAGLRLRREIARVDGMLSTQVLPYLTRRAADLDIKSVAPDLAGGPVAFHVVALCAMIEARERGGQRPE